MIRLVAVGVVILVLAGVIGSLAGSIRRWVERLRKQRQAAPRYDWEPRTNLVKRQLKGVPQLEENREGILAFIESRSKVEAWVEPRTAISPLSVLLVAEDGESVRFHLADDHYLRELTRERGLRIHDAIREGYPQRKRDYQRRKRQASGEHDRPDAPPE